MGNNVYNMDNFRPLADLPDDDYITDVFYPLILGHEVFGNYLWCVWCDQTWGCYLTGHVLLQSTG